MTQDWPAYRILRRRGITICKTIDLLIGTGCIDNGKPLLNSDGDFRPMTKHLGLPDTPGSCGMNGPVRQWAKRGTRPRQTADQRCESAYLLGAICLARGKGGALALPFAGTRTMQLHLDEIARHVVSGTHAVRLLDRAE